MCLIGLLWDLKQPKLWHAQHGAWYTDGKWLVSVIFVVVIMVLGKLKGTSYFGTFSEGIPKKQDIAKRKLKIISSYYQEW